MCTLFRVELMVVFYSVADAMCVGRQPTVDGAFQPTNGGKLHLPQPQSGIGALSQTFLNLFFLSSPSEHPSLSKWPSTASQTWFDAMQLYSMLVLLLSRKKLQKTLSEYHDRANLILLQVGRFKDMCQPKPRGENTKNESKAAYREDWSFQVEGFNSQRSNRVYILHSL